MSKREKVLGLVVASLVPFALVLYAITYVGGELSDKSDALSSLQDQYNGLQKKFMIGKLAATRRAAYLEESLPSRVVESKLQYGTWLTDLAEEKISLADVVVNQEGQGTPVGKNPRDPVMTTYKFTLSGKGTIRQLTELVYQFNQTKLLHKISGLRVSREVTGTAGRQKPTGRLVLNLTIEVGCIPGASERREFEEQTHEFSPRDLDDYHDIVSRRNLFGPARKPPRFGTDSEFEFRPGQRIAVDLELEDDRDALEYSDPVQYTYEVLDAASEDFELVHASPEEPSAKLQLPELALGTHDYRVRVVANTWPPATVEHALSITVAEEPKKVVTIAETRPEARDTYLSGDTTYLGKRFVWIVIRPQDRTLRLGEGDSFELDNKTWTVVKIEGTRVTINCEGQHLVFRQGHSLDDPEPDTAVSARTDQ